jgi:two-component system phosphate regulon response regulator PhoB
VASVLLIDSDDTVFQALVPGLEDAGHTVRISRTGANGLLGARANPPDVIVLESSLPDLSGTEVCRSLKADEATRDTHVLFVSSKNTEGERLLALELGADDFVAKPLVPREIVLRIQAVTRRMARHAPSRPAGGPLSIDRAAHRVFVYGQEIPVTVIELRLLCALYDGGSRVQSREALLREVWGNARGITTRTVDTHVKRLRKKLGDAAACIRSVRGVGYGFDAPSDAA